MTNQTELTTEQVGRRGEEFYQEHLRKQVEAGNIGRYLALDIDSGEYEIGDDRLETVHHLKARIPTSIIYALKIGYPVVAVIGGRLRPSSDSLGSETKKPQ